MGEEQAEDGEEKSSGTPSNPWKRYFLKPAADADRDLSNLCDENDQSYPRRAMTRCGLAKQRTGGWEARPLSSHMQNNVLKYRLRFEEIDCDSVSLFTKSFSAGVRNHHCLPASGVPGVDTLSVRYR